MALLTLISPKIYSQTESDKVKSGDQKLEASDYDGAIKDYSDAVALNPQNTYAVNNRCISYFYKKDFQNAIADFTKAIELNPQYVQSYKNRGDAYRMMKDYENAITDYKKAVEINPEYADAYGNMGLAYYRQGKLQDALKWFLEAVDNYESNMPANKSLKANALKNIAFVYDDLNEFESVIEYYKQSIDLLRERILNWSRFETLTSLDIQKCKERTDYNTAQKVQPHRPTPTMGEKIWTQITSKIERSPRDTQKQNVSNSQSSSNSSSWQ